MFSDARGSNTGSPGLRITVWRAFLGRGFLSLQGPGLSVVAFEVLGQEESGEGDSEHAASGPEASAGAEAKGPPGGRGSPPPAVCREHGGPVKTEGTGPACPGGSDRHVDGASPEPGGGRRSAPQPAGLEREGDQASGGRGT